jgi:hypothetical protein
VAGCGLREPEWRTYEETRTSAGAPPRPSAPPQAVSGSASIRWTTPAGWTEQAASGMRLATFSVEREGHSATCTIVSLGGAAGGIEANVVRWLGQLGQPEPPREELESFIARQAHVHGPGGFHGTLVDLTELGEPSPEAPSMLAALLNAADATLFVKMTGPKKMLSEEKPSFTSLCESLRAGE